MSLADLVTVTVTKADASITRAGFGTPMVAFYHTKYADRIRSYQQADDMLADGFATTDKAYKAVAKAKSQKPAPQYVKVGRLALIPTMVLKLTPKNLTANRVDTFVVEGPNGTRTTITVTNDGTPTVAEWTALATAAIDAISDVAATDGTTFVTVTAAAGLYFDIDNLPGRQYIEVEMTTADPGIATDLAAIAAVDNDWIFFEVPGASKAIALAAAAWAEAQTLKIYGNASPDSAIADSGSSTDVAAAILALSYAQTVTLYSGKRTLSYGALAWASALLPYDPGSATWALKNIVGQVADVLSSTELDTIHDKRANAYVTNVGRSHTSTDSGGRGGFTPMDWIDGVIGIMYIRQRMAEDIAGLQLSAKKIPYTRAGMATYETYIRARLDDATRKEILSADEPYQLTMLDPAASFSEGGPDPADKAARIGRDLARWSAIRAGAVHHPMITGTVADASAT